MLTKKQVFAVTIVRRLHIIAGVILDAADAIENRILLIRNSI
jgi:hypothetical protein